MASIVVVKERSVRLDAFSANAANAARRAAAFCSVVRRL
jgi:hypothetical protein